jgi:hypothetical protein
MSRIALLLMTASLLAGCFTDQRKQEAACELRASEFVDAHLANTDVTTFANERGQFIMLCMRAHGYEPYATDECAASFPLNLADPQSVQPIINMRSEEAVCYRPMGWGARQLQTVERLFR